MADSTGFASPLDKNEWESTVAIVTVCADGHNWLGSGFAVGPHTIITAKHVITCEKSSVVAVGIHLQDGRSFLVSIGKLASVDAATLIVKETLPSHVSINTSPPVIGAPWCDITGLTRVRKCGQVSTVSKDGDVFIGMRTIHGDSGSPFFNERGEVVGIVVSILSEHVTEEFITVAIPSYKLLELLVN